MSAQDPRAVVFLFEHFLRTEAKRLNADITVVARTRGTSNLIVLPHDMEGLTISPEGQSIRDLFKRVEESLRVARHAIAR